MPSKIKGFETSFLVAEKGSSFIVPAPSLKEGCRLLLSALKAIGRAERPPIVASMVKRSIFLNGSERIVSSSKVSEKMLDKALRSL
jgi:hypothetical protein